MNILRQYCETLNDNQMVGYRFKKGEKVEIISGLIQGLAEVANDNTQGLSKVDVLLRFMGGPRLAEIPIESLKPARSVEVSHVKASRGTRGKGRRINHLV